MKQLIKQYEAAGYIVHAADSDNIWLSTPEHPLKK
jgi:hypothetical protein